VKLGRRSVRKDVRSCPSDRFFCSLGLRCGGSFSACRFRGFLRGRVKVGASNAVGGGTFAAVAGCAEELPFSSFEFNCFNLLKYRSEANSVMWRGSMMSCVWPLCHPVAVLEIFVNDKAYQDRERRRSSQEGRQCRARCEGRCRDVVASVMLTHHWIRRGGQAQSEYRVAAACLNERV
jgi:hypothetical protein